MTESTQLVIDIIVRAAALVIALGVLHRLGLAIYRTAKRIEHTFDLVHHELQPNSGSSLYDAIKRIDQRVEVLEAIDRRSEPRRTRDDHADA